MCNGMSSKEYIFTCKKVLPNSNVQWNVFKGVYFYWEKSTPQFKIELISGEYFFPCGSKFFPGKYYSGSTFFPGNYYSGSNFFREVIIYGYTGSNLTGCLLGLKSIVKRIDQYRVNEAGSLIMA